MKIKLTHKNGTIGFIQKNRRDPMTSGIASADIFTAQRAKIWITQNTADYWAMGWTVSVEAA